MARGMGREELNADERRSHQSPYPCKSPTPFAETTRLIHQSLDGRHFVSVKT